MPILAVSGEYKFLRYMGQDIDAVYIKGVKAYGKNLWCFANSGANDYGSNTVEAMDNLSRPQHYKFTVTSISTSANLWSRLFQSLYPDPNALYDMSKTYSFSVLVKPSLNKVRVYVYLGVIGGSINQTNYPVDLIPNIWNKIVFENRPPADTPTSGNKSLLGFRYLQTDHAGINLVGQTLEVKDIKLEEGSLSPYSINSTLL